MKRGAKSQFERYLGVMVTSPLDSSVIKHMSMLILHVYNTPYMVGVDYCSGYPYYCSPVTLVSSECIVIM